jgi:ABC-2 type transport system ATP-binding protein
MLQVRELWKRYGSIDAVGGASFDVEKGTCVGLLGPNGAGKTTTVSAICGLVRPDKGTVSIDGQSIKGDTDPTKRRIGLVTQELALYDELSALNNLQFFGALYGLKGEALERASAGALALVGLTDRAGHAVKTYSGGMKRRLNIAAALLHDPEWIILDEPTVGVDPQSRNAIFDNLETLRERGKSLIYATHYMEEAERLCDRVVIMDRGKVVADDTLRGLLRLAGAVNRLRVEVADGQDAAGQVDALRGLAGVSDVTLEGSVLTAAVEDLAEGGAAVLGCLSERCVTVEYIESERANLESVFLTLTGRSLRDS